MSLTPWLQDALTALALVSGGAVGEPQVAGDGGTLVVERLLVATSALDGPGGLLAVRGPAPWPAQALAATDAPRRVRVFADEAWVVASAAGTLWRVPLDGGPARVHDLGPDSAPQDVLVPSSAATHAWVSLRHDPRLQRLDLRTGALTPAVDLSPVGAGAELEVGTMVRDGQRLFVQLALLDDGEAASGPAGALAVVDLASGALLDVEPRTPGVQGVALAGAAPRFDMQVVQETRTLFVSSTEGELDGKGAIEMVDLDNLVSVGFAVSEQQLADLGGFVMVDGETGYLVFHTDLIASTHLKRFTVSGGPDPAPELVLLIGDTVDQLAHDPASGHVYLPSGFANGNPVVHVIDVASNTALPEPIALGQRAVDVVPISSP